MHENTRAMGGIILTAVSLAAACRSDDRGIADTATLRVTAGSLEGPRSASAAPGAGAMHDMKESEPARGSTRHMSAALMDSMERRLKSLEGVSAAQMTTIVPAHRQMVDRLLSELDADMRAMNMAPDAAWRALTDSVRRDLRRMPEMEGSELRVFMPDHHSRVDRLMAMHRRLMGGRKT